VTVDRRLEPDLPEVVGSEDQLQQVFMNLFSNAAEAMEVKGGGTLRIEAAREPGDSGVQIRVADTGVGIPAANMPRLFEPFFTTKKKGGGWGWGSRWSTESSRSTGARSGAIRPRRGTTFSIRLPIAAPTPPDHRRRPP
jgi:two-component system, NtrC family, sensor kinase